MAAIATKIAMYNYSGDPRLVNKAIPTYNPQGTNVLNAYLSNTCDIMHPTVTIPYNANVVYGQSVWNYAYIPDWGRYYFVSNYTTDSAGKLILNLDIDVLTTYATNILGSDVTVVRWSGAGINYVQDDKLPVWATRTKKIVHNLTPVQDGGYLDPNTHKNILIGLI